MTDEGQAVEVRPLAEGFLELRFDRKGESINKLDTQTRLELKRAVARLAAEPGLRGVLLTSGKDVFVAGADIGEFPALFRKDEREIAAWLLETDAVFSALEDLAVPSVAAINGPALGGGFELCLAASFRVISSEARVGLPETRLGLIPGWGGTVRLSRLCGADTAIEWISSGEPSSAGEALKAGAVDALVAPADLHEAALRTLREAAEGRLDWRARREQKKAPLRLNAIEAGMVFASAKALLAAKAGPHLPAPAMAVEAIERAAGCAREAALEIEAACCAKLARTESTCALVGVFLGEQAVKRAARRQASGGRAVRRAGVLGAGIMGGGIAYQSALRGVSVLLKDVSAQALAAGMAEAGKLLAKQVERGKLTSAQMAATLAAITPTPSYADFATLDFAVEAVVENEEVKKKVLAELEAAASEQVVLASNTSTISISRLATALRRPERFCGMHFFNPVPRMPLVEVVRGTRSGDGAVATAVAYALAIGKTPIVVNDCAGFLVNRVLFPYFAGFERLLADGLDYELADQVLERWGWPMGPARLLDVIGLDTSVHAARLIAEAFPERMGGGGRSAMRALFEAGRLGQKSGRGFYLWRPEPKGPPSRQSDPEARAIVYGSAPVRSAAFSEQEIVERAMLPMLLESTRCLEEKIVATASEVDIALLNGLGFPAFRGGIFRWADAVGAEALVRACERQRGLGALYAPSGMLAGLAASGKGFHGE